MENRPPKRKIIKRQQKFVIEDSSQDNDFLRETASDCKGGRQYTKFSKTFSGKSAIRSNAQWNTVSKLSTRASVNRQYFTESRRKSVIKRPLPETAVPDIQDLSVAFKTPVKSLRRSSRRIIKKKATECLFDVTFTPEKHCVPSQTDIEPASSLPLSENDGTVCHKRQKLSFDDAVLDETMDHASQVDGSDVKMRTGDECLYPDSTDMAPIASSWKLSEIGPVKPSKKQKKFLPNGLAANFSLFTRREAAARTFWKHNQTIPVGYIDVQKPMEPVASSKPSGLVLTVVEVTDEDLHVLQVLCLVNGRQDRDAGHFDRNDSSEGSVTVIFSAQEFKKAELGVGAVIQLTQPWMTLPSADRSTTIILCPYFFQVVRKFH